MLNCYLHVDWPQRETFRTVPADPDSCRKAAQGMLEALGTAWKTGSKQRTRSASWILEACAGLGQALTCEAVPSFQFLWLLIRQTATSDVNVGEGV